MDFESDPGEAGSNHADHMSMSHMLIGRLYTELSINHNLKLDLQRNTSANNLPREKLDHAQLTRVQMFQRTLARLGVIWGDIVTSPLYTFSSAIITFTKRKVELRLA